MQADASKSAEIEAEVKVKTNKMCEVLRKTIYIYILNIFVKKKKNKENKKEKNNIRRIRGTIRRRTV